MIDFIGFPKIGRLLRNCVVTEKLDGTNAQIYITECGQFLTGSRNRWITPEDDNYGFSRWAHENREELMELGVGQHFGEWWGNGIQRRYAQDAKKFSLFNAGRWNQDNKPGCCEVVPILYEGIYDSSEIQRVFLELQKTGSVAAPGYMNPEGIIVYHSATQTLFKQTFEHDAKGKPE